MTQQEFKQTLRESYGTKFKFTKKNGEERIAVGTLNFDAMPETAVPSGTQTWEDPEDIVKYYDLEKSGWRSFRWEQFVEIL